MKYGIVICIALSLLCGCATTPTVPAGCEKSVIYKIPQADLVGVAGVVAITEGLKMKPEAKPYVCKFANTAISAMADKNLTYLDMATIIVDNVKWINSYFGSNILIYKILFTAFDKPLPLDSCDIRYLTNNMQQLLATAGCL